MPEQIPDGIYPYRLLVAMRRDGSVGGVSIQRLTRFNGRDREDDPEPLAGTTDPAFVDFADQFSAAAVAERDSLRTQVQTLESEKATLTSERDTLTTQLADKTTALDAATAELTDLRPAVAERDSLQSQLDAALAELDAIKNPPPKPRELPPYSFYLRFTQAERRAIRARSFTDEIIGDILDMLMTVRKVDLDHPETQQGIGYLQAIGMLTTERAAEILADARPEEQ